MLPVSCLLGSVLITTVSAVIIVRVNETSDGLPFYCQYCNCTMQDDGIITDCYSKGLFRPPRNLSTDTTELYLRKNRLAGVVYEHLQNMTKLRVLDLSGNVIKGIDIGAFKDLENLEELYLHENKFNSYRKSLPFGAFDGLKKLKHLTLHGCITWRTAMASKLPQYVFLNLTALESLSLDGVDNVMFDKGFRQLKHLTSLTMSGTHGECAINNLTEYAFTGLPNLVDLTLDKCYIKHIDKYTFYSLNNLTHLDLSGNEDLGFAGLGEIYLQATNLKTLKINSIHSPNRAGSEILRGYMRNIEETSLTEIYMESNGLEYIDYGVFDKLPRTLRYLSMRDNRLTFGLYLYEAVFNTNLEVFDAGYQFPVIRPDRAFTKVYTGFINQYRRKKRDAELTSRHDNKEVTYEVMLSDPSGDNGWKVAGSHNELPREVNVNKQQLDISNYHGTMGNDKMHIEPLGIGRTRNVRFKHRLIRSAHEKGYTTIKRLICSGS